MDDIYKNNRLEGLEIRLEGPEGKLGTCEVVSFPERDNNNSVVSEEDLRVKEFTRERLIWLDTWDETPPAIRFARERGLIKYILDYKFEESELSSSHAMSEIISRPHFSQFQLMHIKKFNETTPAIRDSLRELFEIML